MKICVGVAKTKRMAEGLMWNIVVWKFEVYEEGVCKIEPLKYKVPTQYGRFGTSNLEVLGSIPGKSALPGDRTLDLEVRSPKSTCIDLYRVATLKFNGKIGHHILWFP